MAAPAAASAAAQQDKYGFGKALGTYEMLYTGARKLYDEKYGTLDKECTGIDAKKNQWQRHVQEYQSQKPDNSKPLIEQIRASYGKIYKSEETAKQLLDTLSKVVSFLETRPIPTFDIPLPEKLGDWTAHVKQMAARVKIISDNMALRIPAAIKEGDCVLDVLSGRGPRTWIATLNHQWSGESRYYPPSSFLPENQPQPAAAKADDQKEDQPAKPPTPPSAGKQ